MDKQRFLICLAQQYPTIDSAATEIINLQSILNLPKGTEHYLSDIHGEYKAFSHILRNGSGAVMKKIDDVFGDTLFDQEKFDLATLIYYPSEKLDYVKSQGKASADWYRINLYRLVSVCQIVSSKYTRSKVRKALPDNFKYIIEELITEKKEVLNKKAYYDEIINTIIEIGCGDEFIIEMSNLIQQLVIDHLHIIGDIYDRGSGSHFVMDSLMNYHSLDIQWGNHDVLWMGASVGQTACIANIVRTSLMYDNLSVLENGYGISLMPLVLFAIDTYKDDECEQFTIRLRHSTDSNAQTLLAMKMQKAIAVIQFKLEGQLIARHPEYKMDNRRLLHKIDFENGTVNIDGKVYEMLCKDFPTVNPNSPYELTPEEQSVIDKLRISFVNCTKLKKHIKLLLDKGNMYKVCNNNLLFHGCVPLNDDGSFRKINLFGNDLTGKNLYNEIERCVRKAFYSIDEAERIQGSDLLWYLWNGPDSPLYGRSKMTTFERYFIADKTTHTEIKDNYYSFIEDKSVVQSILSEFELTDESSHIINGHVPIQHSKGESPLKCGGKVIIIDGGFSQPYHKLTGIAGYTLIYNSYGLMLTAHQPFKSIDYTIHSGKDMEIKRVASEIRQKRILVGDTDDGKRISKNIADLKELIKAYRDGTIRQNAKM